MSEGVKKVKDTTVETVTRAASAVGEYGTRGAGAVADAVAWSYGKSKSGGEETAKAATAAVKRLDALGQGLLATGQGLLATELANNLNDMLAQLAKGAPTIYDKMMDAQYLETQVGGGLHRLFDGGHTLWGAFEAARDAPGEDGLIARAMGMTLGLFRDATTPAGLPFFTWDPETYHKVADTLNQTFGIPKQWFADLAAYDSAEVFGGLLGSVALVFRWSDGEARDFGAIVGGTGLAAIVSANPILGVVTLVALAKAFTEARKTGSYEEGLKGLAKGTAVAAAPMAVVPAVVALGGPAGLALAAGMVAGMTVSALAKKVETGGVEGFVEDSKKLASYLSHASASLAADIKNRMTVAADNG